MQIGINRFLKAFGKWLFNKNERGIVMKINATVWVISVIFCFALGGISTCIYAQDRTVTGNVTDASTGEPLPGVNVVIKGTSIGTATNLNGAYELQIEGLQDTLIFSFIGFQTREIPINGRSEIDVTLNPTTGTLDELVVIGYGTESRRMLTTSISSIGRQSVEGVPVSSISTAMQGKLSGVRVYQSNGGQPGSGSTIRIRGGSSITGSNDPLILVDGMRRPLTDINPNDVESIEVLKDAASTAVYGARASNGVVLITTKRGSEDTRSIDVNVSFGSSSPVRTMDLLNAEQWLSYTRPAVANSDGADQLTGVGRGIGTGNGPESPYSTRYLQEGESIPEGYKSMKDPVDPSKTIIFQDNDFQDIVFRNALEQNYHLSASGGSENIKYAAGIEYADIEGISIGSKWERFSGRANVDFNIRDNLEMLINANHTVSYTNTVPRQRNMFARSMFLTPVAKVYYDDGTYATGLNATFTNPLWYIDVNVLDTNRSTTQIGTTLNWDVTSIEGLRTTINANYYVGNETFESFYKTNVFDSTRPASFDFSQPRRGLYEGLINYTPSFLGENHNLNLLTGISYEDTDNLVSRSSAFGGTTDDIQTLNAAPEKTEAYTFRTDEVLIGSFGRLSYDYNGKYLFTLSLRRDASSRFAPGNRVGYFPGVSVGWIITEEKFVPNTFISFLKLRSSVGQTGNIASGLYDAFGEYNVGHNYYNESGVFATSMPNFALEWEKSTQWDIGVDLSMLNEKLSMSLDYYEKVTDNLLFNTPLPGESGYSSIQRNIGSVKFYGWDLELTSDIIQRNKFNWTVGFNLSYNKNEVLELPDNGVPKNRIGGVYNPETGVGFGGIAEGEPLYQMIGYKSDFIIDNWEQANNAHYDSNAAGYDPETGEFIPGKKFPGDMEWVDKNGDGRIDVYDQFVLGTSNPHTFGGISNRISYGGFELHLFMDYAIGHSINNIVQARADGNVAAVVNATTNVLNSWKEIGDVAAGRASEPRFMWNDHSNQENYHRNSDRFITRADYLSIREAKLTFTLPSRILSGFGLTRCSIYLKGQNLHYFTKYGGFSPEFDVEGDDNYGPTGIYPLPRKFLVGINLSF